MPFSVVLTEENSRKLISLVPSNWIKGSVLFWPNIRKTAEIERLRREEKQPSEDWKKIKCKVKAHGIETFAEGIKIENLYASFEDTEDEERYNKNRAIKRKHPTFKAITNDLLDMNSYFKMTNTSQNSNANAESEAPNLHITENSCEMNPEHQNPSRHINANAGSEASIIHITENGGEINPEDQNLSRHINANAGSEASIIHITENGGEINPEHQNPSRHINANAGSDLSIISENCIEMNEPEHQNDENLITIGLAELNSLIAENSALVKENQMLKESSQQFQTLEQQTQRGFAVIQVQLDKLFELMQNQTRNHETVISNLLDEEEIIAQKNVQFPLKSKEELDILENQLDTDFDKALVKHFSKICGTSGKLKVGKIGLLLVKHMFTDELLNQLTWKGIKGCTKVPFLSYIKIRNLFFQIIHLADNSCSAKDTDALLQNSAIKHSGQRIKRKSCDMKKIMPKKKKIEFKENKAIDNTSDTRPCSSDELKKVTVLADVNITEEKENKAIDNSSDTRHCSTDESRKVTVLSDVKITNKIMDSKHETKMLNISNDNLLSSPVFKQKDECSNSTSKISFKL